MNSNDTLANHGIIVKGNFGFFWGGILSNWYISKFELHGIEFNCVEQYMMARKAIAFKDENTLERIMLSNDPREQKQLGRAVKGYDDNKWKRIKYPLVLEGVIAKFDQNSMIQQILLDTQSLILVEASPYDDQWGIKLGLNDANLTNPSMWKGTNLLGLALMDARATIKSMVIDD